MRGTFVAVGVAVVIGMNLRGCGGSPEPSPGPADTRQAVRVVSLSPAISRTLVDLGLGDRIVGRTRYCASLDPAIPAVGDLLSLDYERLVRLSPTHVLVQPPASGLDPGLERLAQDRGWTIGAWPLNDLDDIEKLVLDVPAILFPGAGEAHDRAVSQAANLLNALAEALTPPPLPAWRGRTLIASQVDPVLVFGEQTYLDDMLGMLGASNAVTAGGWASLTLEDVARINPEAIIVVRLRPGEPRVGEAAVDAIGVLATLEIEAVRRRRLAVLAHPEADLPCTAVIEVAGQLKSILQSLGAQAPP